MKPEDAISIIENMRPGCGEKLAYPEGEVCEALDMAAEALREIRLYRLIKDATIEDIAEVLKEFSEIGTVEECRAAMKYWKPARDGGKEKEEKKNHE